MRAEAYSVTEHAALGVVYFFLRRLLIIPAGGFFTCKSVQDSATCRQKLK